MMTMPLNGDSTPRLNPTVQIPPWDSHADPTANIFPHSPPNHFLNNYFPSSDNFTNDSDDLDIPSDQFSCDHFRMYEFKIRKCTRVRPHDWTECPFAHSGEKARRRDPRRFQYSGNPCPEFRNGNCSRGDACEHAHGVFECWLHPARYRTQACKDGVHCRRGVCFFAHTNDQLRVLSRTESGHDSPRSGSEWTESPPGSPSWNSLGGLAESMRGLHVGRMRMSPPGWGCKTGFSLARSPGQTRPVFMSLPSTPTHRPGRFGLGMFDLWEQSREEEPAMERVESGRDLRAKIYAKLSKENSFESGGLGPDVGWVSELLK